MADVELVIRIPESLYNFVRSKTSVGNSRNFDDYDMYDVSRRIANGTPLPEHHGDLKDIGNMELLNVQVHDDYSKGWHNAIEYCVRQLRERTTIIPATKEGENE